MSTGSQCVIIGSTVIFEKIVKELNLNYNHYILHYVSISALLHSLKHITPSCLLIEINTIQPCISEEIFTLKLCLDNIPIIGIIDKPCINLARECGEAGVSKIVLEDNIKFLEECVAHEMKNDFKNIDWSLFGIDYRNCSKRIQNALDLIEMSYHKNISVEYIANQLLVSPQTLNKDFKTVVNLTPKKILMLLKFRYASELLRNTTISIKNICFRVGFSAPQNFHKFFINMTGLTPNQFRKKH